MSNYLKSFLCACLGLTACVLLSSTVRSEELTPDKIKSVISKSMEYLKGKAAIGGPQYSDYVVFCGASLENDYPDYKEVIAPYKKWIVKKDRFLGKGPYLYFSSCHVMALDLVDKDKALEMAKKFKPYANDGQWAKVRYHLGWYLYCCIVAGEKELADKTFKVLSEGCAKTPNRYDYFVAYCILKIYDRTKEEKYQKMFLSLVQNMKKFEKIYCRMALKDGHIGMTLYDFCIAYKLSNDEAYKSIAGKLAKILIDTQQEDGSWNKKTAYTIMPAEGLNAYLKYVLNSK